MGGIPFLICPPPFLQPALSCLFCGSPEPFLSEIRPELRRRGILPHFSSDFFQIQGDFQRIRRIPQAQKAFRLFPNFHRQVKAAFRHLRLTLKKFQHIQPIGPLPQASASCHSRPPVPDGRAHFEGSAPTPESPAFYPVPAPHPGCSAGSRG